jgi:hypothetical protein
MSSPPCGSSSFCKNHKRKADSDLLDVCVPTLVQHCVSVAPHVVGYRTFLGELLHYIIAEYKNPRAFCGLTTSGDGSYYCDTARCMAFYPSQVQAAAVLSKCIPRHLSESFTERFLHHQGLLTAGSWTVHDAIPPGAQICKTFVLSIHQALVDTFGIGNVSVQQFQFMNCDHNRSSAVDNHL